MSGDPVIMKIPTKFLVFVTLLSLSSVACGGGSGGTSDEEAAVIDDFADELIEESINRYSGRYSYSSDATTMFCSDGTTVPLPAVSDEGTLTQDGNSFTFTLDIEASVPVSSGASSSSECMLINDTDFTCEGSFADENAVTTFSGSGMFSTIGSSSVSFAGADDLMMTLNDGVFCTWSKTYSAEKIGE